MELIVGMDDTVWVPAVAHLTVDGEPQSIEFHVRFKRLTRSSGRKMAKRQIARLRELQQLTQELQSLGNSTADEVRRGKIDAKLDNMDALEDADIRQSVLDVRGLIDPDGQPVDYSPEVLDALMDHPAYFDALRNARLHATGKAEDDRLKN